MSHTAYSTFRTPKLGSKQKLSIVNSNGVGSDYSYGGVQLRRVQMSDNELPIESQMTGNFYASSAVHVNSKIENGFRTLPSTFHRGVRLYDPLNNTNRFKRRSDLEGGLSNNFDYYRNQQKSSSVQAQPVSKDFNALSIPQSRLATSEYISAENKPSLLLSSDENRIVFKVLGSDRQTLATAVGRLLVPTPNQQRWKLRDSTGVVCLVNDTMKMSHYIYVISLNSCSVIYCQEIYSQFEYQMPQATFMTFEGDYSMIAVLFADMSEASKFRKALDRKLDGKRFPGKKAEGYTKQTQAWSPSAPTPWNANANNTSNSKSGKQTAAKTNKHVSVVYLADRSTTLPRTPKSNRLTSSSGPPPPPPLPPF